ncbi:MAG TPA: DUF1127 domain-containing protein [Reyranella sp.]|jgi:uncharacterized protein YjiS (DUF1127 family)|nr:DUF1127 domain-containing protein [Reyranella sp.]
MHNTLRFHVPAIESNARHLWPPLIARLALWRERSRSRRHLALLDDRALADIGLSRAEQWQESRKRFWQP